MFGILFDGNKEVARAYTGIRETSMSYSHEFLCPSLEVTVTAVRGGCLIDEIVLRRFAAFYVCQSPSNYV